jgi:hypothetical protein
MTDIPPVAISIVGSLLSIAGALAVRVYGADKTGAEKLLREVVGRLETSQREAFARIAEIERRLRELELEQERAGAHQAALDARLGELRTDFRAASEKLDTITELLAAIRSRLELEPFAYARSARRSDSR